ncbi:MAG TPA: protein phosphatase 2C domain-containing protein [Alphaproteobacteria bacterium]|jgi:serine/threonine protein phosphatase PrpC|nr:protein phosphatase 2C domain-containing protein [Alphaproteobacteria bacterium]
MAWDVAKADAIGGRDEQQDRVEVLSGHGGHLLVVADGLGGHKGGAQAAQAVVDAARALWAAQQRARQSPADLLRAVCAEAHRRINALAPEADDQPHSTCVLLHLDEREAHWAHIGDSRLYHFRDHALVERSRDHSVVQMLVDLGRIAETEMATHPDQNRLTQSLGGGKPPDPTLGSSPVAPGDGYLLCSDGLWEAVSTDDMAVALAGGALGTAVRRLAARAAEKGGPAGDNVSVAVARRRRRTRPGNRALAWAAALTAVAAALLAAVLLWPMPAEQPGRGATDRPRAAPPSR